jgi:hypothetical protein
MLYGVLNIFFFIFHTAFTLLAFIHHAADSSFLVYIGYLVWMGLLCLYRLALAGKGSHGHS